MQKCVIIGSKGYIGSHMEWYLTQLGIKPMCYDAVPDTCKNYSQIDLTNKSTLDNLDINVDFIFYFAGLTGTYEGFIKYEKYLAINELGLLNLLDVIRKSPYRPKIIFPSTRLVYKGSNKALKEDDIKETKTVYSVNKLACEGFLQAYKASFDIPFTVFRICIPYGNLLSNNYSFGTIGFFSKMASIGKDITLYGGGNIKRTFTHIDDLCFQIINGAFNDKSNGEIYNIGGETFTLREVASIIAKKYGKEVIDIPWPDKDLRIESDHTFFESTKIESLLGGDIRYHSLKNEIL